MLKPAIASLSRLRPILPSRLQVRNDDKSVRVEDGVKEIPIPGIPFFRDDRHRRPTRALYRQLLRSTKSTQNRDTTSDGNAGQVKGKEDEIDWNVLRVKIREDWRKRKGMTSIPQTIDFLESQYTHLSTLQSQSASSELAASSHRLVHQQTRALTRAERTKLASPSSSNPGLKREGDREVRPYVAGFLRPSYNNPPLPRLKPQPIKLSLMIKSRVKARQRLVEYQKYLWETEQGLKAEIDFSRKVKDREGLEEMKVYLAGLRIAQEELQKRFERDERRKSGMFGVGVVKRVIKAKRARQEFKRKRAEERKAASAGQSEERVLS